MGRQFQRGSARGIIPTYLINVKERTDRLNHSKRQFSTKPEFYVTIVEAVTNSNGAVGLWESTLKSIKLAQQRNHDYILLCEDDNQFTKNYTLDKLLGCISAAEEREADILLGGIHWFNSVMRVTSDLFWVDKFTGTHFVIIFRRFFDRILEADFAPTDVSDLKISDLTDNKLVIYPFISIQKEFGYSDVTPRHNKKGYLDSLFETTASLILKLDNIHSFYRDVPTSLSTKDMRTYSKVSIPTYIINSPKRIDQLDNIKKQFENRREFDPMFIEPCKHENPSVSQYNTHLKIVEHAFRNQHDVIIICEDDHEFTSAYSWQLLLRNILEAHQQGADLLYAGAVDYGLGVPITSDRFWVNQLVAAPFVVVFRNLFDQLLQYEGDKKDEPYDLSQLTENKMSMCPSISIRRNVESRDTSGNADILLDITTKMNSRTKKRMDKMKEAYLRYSNSLL